MNNLRAFKGILLGLFALVLMTKNFETEADARAFSDSLPKYFNANVLPKFEYEKLLEGPTEDGLLYNRIWFKITGYEVQYEVVADGVGINLRHFMEVKPQVGFFDYYWK